MFPSRFLQLAQSVLVKMFFAAWGIGGGVPVGVFMKKGLRIKD